MKRITKDRSKKNTASNSNRVAQTKNDDLPKQSNTKSKQVQKANKVESIEEVVVKTEPSDELEVKLEPFEEVVVKSEPFEDVAGKTDPFEGVEVKSEALSVDEPEVTKVSPSSIKKRDHLKVEVKQEGVEDEKKIKWAPPHWEKQLENLREMRKNFDAPVDTMGCDKCSEEDAPPHVIRFQCLVALMLSSQTKDTVTHPVMQKLIAHGCTVNKILETPDEELEKLIHPVGFYKKKAQYLKKTCTILRDEYQGDIPKSINDLLRLPGVGLKMAHLCMQTAWGQVTGIGVDTHVHRISNRLGWVRETKNPEQTRKQLEDWLPEPLWSEVNHLLVGFGQQTCKPTHPHCATCLNYDTCPYGIENLAGTSEVKNKITKSKK